MNLKKDECNYIDVARFIGIYLVVFGHITLLHKYSYLSYMIYAFHMPLFFMLSGILHKSQSSKRKSFNNNFYRLIIPFFIYNGVAYLYLLVVQKTSFQINPNDLYIYLTIQNTISGATWFFIVLFGLKTIAVFLTSKKSYIVASIACFTLLLSVKYFFPDAKNLFLYKSTLMAFPYFAFGYLIKDKLDITINATYKIAWILLSVPILYFSTKLGSISIAETTYYNLFFNFFIAIIGSIAVLFFSQLTISALKCQFIKDMSRGTMIIVGLHFFIIHQVLPNIFGGQKPITHALLLSTMLFLAFYPIIKLTYKRIPILYGRHK